MKNRMKKLGALREDQHLEYYIRRYQHAIRVIQNSEHIVYVKPCQFSSMHAFRGKQAQQEDILYFAYKIIPLKKRFYELTGRCSPSTPKWPD